MLSSGLSLAAARLGLGSSRVNMKECLATATSSSADTGMKNVAAARVAFAACTSAGCRSLCAARQDGVDGAAAAASSLLLSSDVAVQSWGGLLCLDCMHGV